MPTSLRLPKPSRSRVPGSLLSSLVVLAGVAGCGFGEGVRAPERALPAGLVSATSPAPPVTDPRGQRVRSENGAIAAASIWAAEVGGIVLAEGGNAADAAVAAAWTLAVTEPSMSGIGGRSSIVVRTAEGVVSGIDGLNQVPGGYREGVAPDGYDRAAIPGVPAALARLHAEHGSWTMERLMAPAIRLAEQGFELPAPEADRFAGAAGDLLAFSPDAAPGTWLRPDGTPWPAGTVFRQPLLARTLRAMAEGGVETFYRGWIADSIDADMRRRGAFITGEELAGYEALRALPVEGTYRGHRILSNFRPASGHAVIQALQTLEAATPGGAPRPGSGDPLAAARWAVLLGQAMGQAIDERGRVIEGSEEASARLLTSPEHARARAAELHVPDGAGAASSEGEPPLLVLDDAPRTAGVHVTDPRDRESTTHMTVVDGSGMIVSLTQSLGPSMGARVVAPGLGFLYATRLGAVPGSRPGSTIAPTLVLRPDGSLMAGLGGAGDARILSAVIQVLSRMIDHGMALDAAVAAPRVHPDGELRLRVEDGPVARWSAPERGAMQAWGFEILPSPSGYFGRVHAVGWDPATGALASRAFGVAEPRWNGGAVAPVGR
jgi:gamma-glutamyltranspeptidase / glutathione hydrolase